MILYECCTDVFFIYFSVNKHVPGFKFFFHDYLFNMIHSQLPAFKLYDIIREVGWHL